MKKTWLKLQRKDSPKLKCCSHIAEYELASDNLSASVASVGELVGVGGHGLQSPMSDGTIEEDFEAALTRDQAAIAAAANAADGAVVAASDGSRPGSGEPVKLSQRIDDDDFADIARFVYSTRDADSLTVNQIFIYIYTHTYVYFIGISSGTVSWRSWAMTRPEGRSS